MLNMYTKFSLPIITIKYLKLVGFEKSWKRKKREEPKSSLGTFLIPITSVKNGILASGFFLRDLFQELNKCSKLQLAEWTINTFKKFTKICHSAASYISTRAAVAQVGFEGWRPLSRMLNLCVVNCLMH